MGRSTRSSWRMAAMLVMASVAVTCVSGRVVIEPSPNGEVGMMSSESKYFNCKLEPKSDNERIAWIDPNGREIVNDPNNRVFVAVKRSQVKLELKNPTKQDRGVYKCVSRDKQTNRETSTTHFKLNVYTPTTVSGPASYRKSEGSNLIMECAANADREAQVEFTWMFGNVDLGSLRKYRIENRQEGSAPSADEVRTVSKLEIRNVSKEHGGKYKCMVDTTNKHLSDEKELDVELNVQYKPRFDEMTPNYIWVSEEAVRQSSPVPVNITCLVQANPVAKIQWNYMNNGIVIPNSRNNQQPKASITDVDNMSVLALEYKTADEIINPRPNSKIRFTCTATNEQGTNRRSFEIKIGRIPNPPQALNIDYKDGFVVLKLNDSSSEPAIDSFRLEVGEHAHVFNRTTPTPGKAFQQYSIEMPLSRGEHKVNIFSHNPVGWSMTPESSYFLSVINAAPSLNFTTALVVMVLAIVLTGSWA